MSPEEKHLSGLLGGDLFLFKSEQLLMLISRHVDYQQCTCCQLYPNLAMGGRGGQRNPHHSFRSGVHSRVHRAVEVHYEDSLPVVWVVVVVVVLIVKVFLFPPILCIGGASALWAVGV